MRISFLVVAGIVLAVAPRAHAQPTDSVAAAEQLFDQARALFEKGDYANACPRFEASQKLAPALGTLLNMATCYEKLGMIASAWGHYREVEILASKAGDVQRGDIARARIKALEPRLPRLVIHPPKAAIAGLVVTRDDASLELAALGVAFYVDPGEHVIAASAPGRKRFSQTVTLQEAQTLEIQLPALVVDPAAARPAARPAITTIVRTDVDPGRDRRLFGMTLGGAGLAAVITSIGFGFAARASWHDAFGKGLCDRATYRCSPAGQDLADTARSRALVANVVGGAGLALVGAGIALYFTAPRRADVAVAPTRGGAAISFGGRW